MFRRLMKTLTMEKRMQLAFYGTSGVCTVLICGYTLPHTVFLNKYKEFMTCYSSGVERQLPDKVLRRFNTACDILKVTDHQKSLLQPFTVFGQDLFHAGTTKSKYGAVIGIPANYSYDTESQIDKKDIKLKTESVNWSSAEGERLQNALVLTEDEQVFGIAREILMSLGYQPGLNVIYPAWTVFFMHLFGRFLNEKLHLLHRPAQIRYVMYTIVSLFAFGVWALLKDGTEFYYERATDEILCTLGGSDLINAGVRFYDKIINKNIAIRGLTNNVEVYSAKGNLNFLFRNKSIPLTERKEFFEAKLRELEKNPAETTNGEDK